MHWLMEMPLADLTRRIRKRVLPNLQHLGKSQFRRCRACLKMAPILSFGATEEWRICLYCRANLRYELLAAYIRAEYPNLERLDIVELDPASPLRNLLSLSRNYIRTFYRPNVERGTRREDGAVCEDITNLTFPDESVDLIISSDVLEHVPDAHRAFKETARVLRRGGAHVFTVPTERETIRRASLIDGAVVHHAPPEYHSDPLDPQGILAYWHYGPDLPEQFATEGLVISKVAGPVGGQKRQVWQALKS